MKYIVVVYIQWEGGGCLGTTCTICYESWADPGRDQSRRVGLSA